MEGGIENLAYTFLHLDSELSAFLLPALGPPPFPGSWMHKSAGAFCGAPQWGSSPVLVQQALPWHDLLQVGGPGTEG